MPKARSIKQQFNSGLGVGMSFGNTRAAALAGLVSSLSFAPFALAQVESTLEEVVVTAQKRSENVQDVPSAISVLPQEQLERLSLQQLSDYVGYVPGFTMIDAGYPGRAQLTLRGVSTGASDNSTVGIHIDESPVGSSTSAARGGGLSVDLLPYDVERIEVLRGPQGTLYGASSMGGLLKYVTRKPDLRQASLQTGLELTTTRGSDDLGWIARAGGTVPLIDDTLAVRASIYRKQLAGIMDNAASGRKDEDEGRQEGARMAALWKATDALIVEFSALAQDTMGEGGGRTVIVNRASGQPRFGEFVTSTVLPQYSDYKLRFYSGAASLDLDWAALDIFSSYSKIDVEVAADASLVFGPFFGPGMLTDLRSLHEVDKLTQEIRLTSPDQGAFQWMLGAFYTDEDTRAAQFGSVRTPDGSLLPPANPLIRAVRPASYRDLSAFGNVTYQFTDRFDVTAGLRYSSNEQHFTTDGGGFLVNAAAGLPPTVITRDTGRSSEDVVTYMVSPRFRPTDDTMLYARVASGYRPGGPNPALAGLEPSFDADRLVNYEVGAKADFLQRRASVDLALFYIDWTDIQLQLNTPTNIVYRANGGNAISKGVELSSTFIPVPGLRIGGNLAYTDARLQEDVPALQAREGDRVPSVPRWTASLTSSYSFPLAALANGEIGFGYRYAGETEYPFESNPTSYALDAYSLVDAYAAAAFERFKVRLFARNLLDERAYSSVLGGGGPGAVQLTLVQPRTIGVSVDLTF